MQGTQGILNRERPAAHDTLRLGHGGLRGDEGLEDSSGQVRSVEVKYFKDHEDPDDRQGAEDHKPPRWRFGREHTPHVASGMLAPS